MARTAIIGDGPGGLSAALFLAKNGEDVVVYGNDETPMHYAMLYNYLGIDEMTGTDFQVRTREQVRGHGASLVEDTVTDLVADGDAFRLTTAQGTTDTVDYVVLAAAKPGVALARQLGIDTSADGIDTDVENRTSVDRVYAIGRLARPARSQAIISAGAGAVAALDVLSREAGKDVADWDSPPSEG